LIDPTYQGRSITSSSWFLAMVAAALSVGVLFFAALSASSSCFVDLRFGFPFSETGIDFSLSLASSLRGVIVETHLGFWVLLAATLVYAFKVPKRNYLISVFLLYVCGLAIRLLVAFHSLYPGSGPWWELGSVHSIATDGICLTGSYYHSGMPVLQLLILLFGSVFGYYATIVFIIPVLAWTLLYLVFFTFFRRHLPPELTILALLLPVTANVLFESTLRAESIAIPLGVLIVHLLLRRNFQISTTELMVEIGLYALLTLTHHLTAAVVLAVFAALIVGERLFHCRVPRNLVVIFLFSGVIFFSYWELYQGLLTEKLALISLSGSMDSMLEIPWPKPWWWWALYLTPKILSVLFIGYFVIDVLRHFPEKSPIENQVGSISGFGGLINALSAVLPGGYLFLRVFHQFFGYHAFGISTLRRSKLLLKILAVSFLFGMIADFPILDSNGYVIGGHWFDHSQAEVDGAEFVATQIPNGSRVAIDGRVEPLIYVFVPRGKIVPKIEAEVYVFNSTEEAWNHSVARRFDYIFASSFYATMFVFKDGSGATRLSESQLNKFSPPYFTEVFGNEDVTIYQVNGGPHRQG
jgi:hypothetical protein